MRDCRLDPVRDHERIVHLEACLRVPVRHHARELAFFRTFAVPSIAQLLASTGEFTDRALATSDLGVERERSRRRVRCRA